MKRAFYIFPLMAFTALSLTLAGCDDNKTEDTAATEQTVPGTAQITAETTATATVNATNATAYATAEGARTGVVFATIFNPQTGIERLVGASSDRAAAVEIHESYVDEADGTMQMRRVKTLEILPSQQVELKPGGYHIMLVDLAAPLVAGETFNVTMRFENAGDVVVPVTVTAPGASATDAMGAEMTAPSTTGGQVQDDGSSVAPSTTTDVPVTEDTSGTTTDEATPDPTTTQDMGTGSSTTDTTVPADEPVTDTPATDDQTTTQ